MSGRPKNELEEWLYNHSLWFWIIFYGLIILMMFFATGCASPKSSLVSHDTIYVSKTDTKIVEVFDSIYIDRWHDIYTNGDTVYVTNTEVKYKYKYIHDTNTTIDTIYINKQSEQVQIQEAKNPTAELWGLIILGIIFGIISIIGMLKKAK